MIRSSTELSSKPPSSLPLVSCIMPTADRRSFVPQAIDNFLRQDYPNLELVILDDGADAVADLIPADPRIRYERLTGRRPLGTKRNQCVEASRGDLILHWDDDDWMASWRVRYQVEQLLAKHSDVCGLDRLFFYNVEAQQAWEYVYPARKRPWVAGGTLCYTRDLWRQHPFGAVNVGEDTRFVWQLGNARLLRLADNRFYAARVHAQNTSPKRTRDPRWQAVPYAQLEALMANDPDLSVDEKNADEKNRQPPMRENTPTQTTPNGTFPNPPVTQSSSHPIIHNAISGPDEASIAGQIHPHDHVTVSLPYWRAEATLRRAVESILSQSHESLTLVVVNDGDDPPWHLLAGIDDPRLVRFDLQENRGRYFADAVVLSACRSPYFCIQDADDWSEPNRIERLLRQLRAEHAVAAVSDHHVHRQVTHRKQPSIERYREINRPLTARFEHRAHHHALFRTNALRAVGGYYGGFRIGYDTLLINLLLMTGRIACVPEPLYHRAIRPNSLSRAAESGFRSAARREATRQLRQLYSDALRAYNQYLSLMISHADLCAQLRRIAKRSVTTATEKALAEEAVRLAPQIAQNRATSLRQGDSTHVPIVRDRSLLDDARLPWDEWSIGRAGAEALLDHLEKQRPRRLLEVGSGVSTMLLADFAARTGASFVSLEHDPQYAEHTQSLLQQFDLMDRVDLRCVPLEPFPTPEGAHPWYAATLDGPFDFVLVDGPPERHGRQAALFALAPHLADRWEIWLHDGNRLHEQRCLALWQRHMRFTYSLSAADPKGFLRLRSVTGAAVQDRLGGLGVSILTGGRLHLLRQTVESLQQHNPLLLAESKVVVFVNGDDPATRSYVETLPFVDRCLHHTDDVLPSGVATSRLMAALVESGVTSCLHLEDDWAADPQAGDWLAQARAILTENHQVGQVRLRHSSERVLSYHMVTRRPIRWRECAGYRLADSAHYTFNPSLIRAADAPHIFPCQDESQAQVNFLRTGLATAQLLPGVFRHVGERESRRLALQRA